MSNQFDFCVFIGRFQPFHRGHAAVIRHALAIAKQVIILCGSAHRPRDTYNPWLFTERERMIRSSFPDGQQSRIHIAPITDHFYNDAAWVSSVQTTVAGIVGAHHPNGHRPANVALVGHKKDHTSYYLRLFPQWHSVEVANVEDIAATSIRAVYFGSHNEDEWRGALESPVQLFLEEFRNSSQYRSLLEEERFMRNYREAWSTAPYPPTFVTVDAVVEQSAHVLLVERKARPGQGLFALPGGFLRPNETLVQGCIRELREETRLKVPVPVLEGSIRAQEVFDAPHRSTRGRTITHAFHIRLQPNGVQLALPKVKGSDDAQHAFWLPIAQLDPQQMFEDHYCIIRSMLRI